MTAVDAALLDLTERLVRRFQALTGRTNVWLALQLTNLSIVVYFVWAGAFVQFGTRGTRIVVGIFCLAVLYLLSRTVFKVSIETSERNAYERISRGLRNPRRLRDAPLRISFLTVSIFLGYPLYWLYTRFAVQLALLTSVLLVLTTALLYLLACDPLPPCRGTVPAWLRGVVRAKMTGAGSSEGASRGRVA